MKRLFTTLALWFGLSLDALAGVNINTADIEALKELPGIGDTKAADIVAWRNANGGFSSIEQLGEVKGIGPATLEKLRPLVELGDGKAAPAPAGKKESSAAETPVPSGPAVNINTANAEGLDALPGIGPSLAAKIILDREQNGAYASCDDLARVAGIGPSTVEKLKPSCTTK
jgi:competence protein ComEA